MLGFRVLQHLPKTTSRSFELKVRRGLCRHFLNGLRFPFRNSWLLSFGSMKKKTHDKTRALLSSEEMKLEFWYQVRKNL